MFTDFESLSCPKCYWKPTSRNFWSCECGCLWNIFHTEGECPQCRHVHLGIECLNCEQMSPKKDWNIHQRMFKKEIKNTSFYGRFFYFFVELFREIFNIKVDKFTKIACPKCKTHPIQTNIWECICGCRWNTFDTGGVCPKCKMQHKTTQCLICQDFSPHKSWYK